MKLVRYGRAGAERPGAIDGDGKLRDLSRLVEDITPAALAAAALRRLRGTNLARLPLVRGRPRLSCPLSGMGKMVCIGLNYTDHAAEVGARSPGSRRCSSRRPARSAVPTTPSCGRAARPSWTTRSSSAS